METTLTINVDPRTKPGVLNTLIDGADKFVKRMDSASDRIAGFGKTTENVRKGFLDASTGASSTLQSLVRMRDSLRELTTGQASVQTLVTGFQAVRSSAAGVLESAIAVRNTWGEVSASITSARSTMATLTSSMQSYASYAKSAAESVGVGGIGRRGATLLTAGVGFGVGAMVGNAIAPSVTDSPWGQYAVTAGVGAAGSGLAMAGKAAATAYGPQAMALLTTIGSSIKTAAVTALGSVTAATVGLLAAGATALGSIAVLSSQSVTDRVAGVAGGWVASPGYAESFAGLERALAAQQARQQRDARFVALGGYRDGDLAAIQSQQDERTRQQPIQNIREQIRDRRLQSEMQRYSLYDVLIGRSAADQRNTYNDARGEVMSGPLSASSFARLRQEQDDLLRVVGQDNPSFRLQRQTLDREIGGNESEAARLQGGVAGLIRARNQERAAIQNGGDRHAAAEEQERILQSLGMAHLSTNAAIEASNHRLLELGQQRLELEEKRDQVNQRERRHNIQTLEQQRAIYQESERFARQQAQSLRQQQRGDESNFGLMDDESRNRVLGVAQRLRAFFAGNGQDNFTNEDLGIARSAPQLRGAIEELGLRRARRDGRFAELEGFALPGQLNRPQQIQNFEAMAGENRNLALRVENEIRANLTLDAEATANELTNRLEPVFERMIETMTRRMAQQLEIQNVKQQMNQLAAQGNNPLNQ